MAASQDAGADFDAPAPRCISIDLEVGRKNQKIFRVGAVRGDTGHTCARKGASLDRVLTELDLLADGAGFVLGHNIIDFDLPHLAAARPDLRLLQLPVIDTLRLNPLAFPRNPYHNLVKHYHDGALKRAQRNDPLLDAQLALDVFKDQQRALAAAPADLLLLWHWLTTVEPKASTVDELFKSIRGRPRPTLAEVAATLRAFLGERGCAVHSERIVTNAEALSWSLAYALAWLSVAGGNSVVPPWVRHQFPQTGAIVCLLRDTPCLDPECAWCAEHHNARKELRRSFGFDAFRPEPADANGQSLQQLIAERALEGKHVLGILPTGTGKSICYQIPALSRYRRTGALTVVISPLVALMADQVDGLKARGIGCCAALNGLLSMPERGDVLDRTRLGDIGILIVSPEQLRGSALRKVLAQREIGGWVLDEAHCLSKWGHDFRPDYRYVARFIRERSGDGAVAPLLGLTATAKPEVVGEIVDHFIQRLGVSLEVFDGGSQRENLEFEVVPTTPPAKLADIALLLERYLPREQEGGAIIYCATRRATEEVAEFLCAREMQADYFHAGLKPEAKKAAQQQFIGGETRVIAATNAFGMGIDKPDVRLVVHADIPGSLENYLQEAGRAGRDREAARCVLLYTPDDVERQFGMSARSRLTQREIQSILRALKRLDRRKRGEGDAEIVATSGEILAEELDETFERDSATDDTRVRTAVCWLEEADLLTREENRVQVFPSSLRIDTLADAEPRFEKLGIASEYRKQLAAIITALLQADGDQGISTDEIMAASGLSPEGVRKAFYDLEHMGIASNDAVLTAYVHTGVERSSQKRFEEATALEAALIAQLREQAPDLGRGQSSHLHLRPATQALKDAGHAHALPEKVLALLGGLANDGRGEGGGVGSIRIRRIERDFLEVHLQRDWSALQETAARRRAAAQCLLVHLLACLPTGARGVDLLAETTMGKLCGAIEADALLRLQVKDVAKLVDRALLWLHEQEVIRLNKGLTVFRPAMTIRLRPARRGFARADFEPLQQHYTEQVVQIHVMAHYAQLGLEAMADALRLAADYFELEQPDFLSRWLPGKDRELARQTTPESWRSIVEVLDNPVQQRIVADDREQTNVLVLAGPGSGKTRVLVHRIAWLVRARREVSHRILALTYNRHAAVEIRRRLAALIGDEARFITVMTCHALAMRLTGSSFARRNMGDTPGAFDEVMREAIALLSGEGLPPDEADAQRDRLLAGFRWILVDEYQDIGPQQYALISALAGRTLNEDDARLSLFAVGDDDQNIYSFAGASVEYIRRFEQDYEARPSYLVENYRSTRHIVDAANLVIEEAAERLKRDNPIEVDRARRRHPRGGEFERLDPVATGRVQILACAQDPIGQAVAAMQELRRVSALDSGWDWTRVAVIAREWSYLDPVRAWCEANAVPVQLAYEDSPGLWRLRETQALVEWLQRDERALATSEGTATWLLARRASPWNELLLEAVEAYGLECGNVELPAAHFIEWLAEWGRELRLRQTGLLLLSAHRAKGLEFDHVVVLDGGWNARDRGEDPDATRRLYYVAMTRARHTLCLMDIQRGNRLPDTLPDESCLLRRDAPRVDDSERAGLGRQFQRLNLAQIDLDFAGRRGPGHPIHRAIAALHPGEALQLREHDGVCEILDARGTTVGKLARAYQPPRELQCVQARVWAISIRRKVDCQPDFLPYVNAERWEVVLPELVFG